MININKFKTYDINLAAVLISQKHVLQEMKINSQRRALFIFAQTQELDKIINDYWADTIRVSPQQLFSAMKSIKTRLYSCV